MWTLSGGSWAKRSSQQISDICLHDGRVVVASGGKLFTLGGQGLQEIKIKRPRRKGSRSLRFGPIIAVASYNDTLYVHDGNRLAFLDGERLDYENIADWGRQQPGAPSATF